MYINNLKINNFRNYNDLHLTFSDKINVIYGDNAQGKTNILEAINLCSTAKSHRTSKENEMIKLGSENFRVIAKVFGSNLEKEINYFFSPERKQININGIPIKKLGELMGNQVTVIFSPDDVNLIKGSPSERRKFIDITLSQIKPKYFYDLQQYGKLLSQRNKLLKEINIKESLYNTLFAWDESIASITYSIMKNRIDYFKKISNLVKKFHTKFTNEMEEIEIKYIPSMILNFDSSETLIKEKIISLLEKNHKKDILRMTTSIGPHRDDFDVFINENNLRIFGSQGQHRTAIISLTLAKLNLIKVELNEYPILLLDDVLSELDVNRQEFLIKNLEDLQVFITTTDETLFKKLNNDKTNYFLVKNGQVVSE